MDRNEVLRQLYRTDPGDIVFGKKWFVKHQKKLLWLLNSPLTKKWFRWCLRILKSDCPANETITEIGPSYFTYGEKLILEKGKLVRKRTTDFRTHDKFSKRLYFAFKPLWYTMHALDWAMLDRAEALTKLSFGFSTLTQYPATTSADNPIDGELVYDAASTYATAHDSASSNTKNSGSTSASIQLYNYKLNASYWVVGRGYACFNTSALTSGATISAVVMSFFVTAGGKANTDAGQSNLHIVDNTLASTSAVALSDFSKIGSTSFGNLAYASVTNNSYADVTLDANGRANVSKTGISKFGMRVSGDLDNSTPTGQNSLTGSSSGVSGTSQDPKLVVTYTTPVAPTVTTEAVSSVGLTTATGNGTVSSDGGSAITERGTVYSTSANPTTSDTKDTAAGTTGAYTTSIDSLSPGTLYHVRAYAINAIGTSYGSDVTFTTLATTTKTETGKARIQKSATQTELGKARITITTVKTETGKARVTASTTKTETGKSRIEASTTQTESGKARIEKSVTQTESGKSRIEKAVTQDEPGKARIEKSVTKDETGVSRITVSVDQDESGKARITASVDQDITGKGNIQATTVRTETGKGRIQKSVDQTETGLARILLLTVQNILGVANIRNTTIQTETGKSRIQRSVGQNETGLARIEKSTPRTTTGVARVEKAVTQDETGKASINQMTFQDEMGKSRIEKSRIETETGKARIGQIVVKVITGKADIQKSTTITETGKGAIRKTTIRTETGKSRISLIMGKTVTGKAKIIAARIYPYSKKPSPYTPFPH